MNLRDSSQSDDPAHTDMALDETGDPALPESRIAASKPPLPPVANGKIGTAMGMPRQAARHAVTTAGKNLPENAPIMPGVDLASLPLVGRFVDRILRWRAFQFLLILPNQILFWLVLITGLIGGTLLPPGHVTTVVHFGTTSIFPTAGGSAGGATPGLFGSALADTWQKLNFSTVITWWIWWSLVWVLMAAVGRGWCMICPFGGFAEWVQRRSLWKRRHRNIGLNLRWPRQLIRLGILPAAAAFVILTFIEEYYNISASADPFTTGLLVLVIIGLALAMHLVFERRTFCTYLCPLTAVFAPLGATGAVAGFRARDPAQCLDCPTKDCMRGGERGYECPWYEWPGSSTSNAMCGLCSECYKACPYGNVGLYAQAPLTSVITPGRRRVDIAAAAVIVSGVIVFMTVNATLTYTKVDLWLNSLTSFPHYPNPLDYIGIIAGVFLAFSSMVTLVKWAAGGRGQERRAGTLLPGSGSYSNTAHDHSSEQARGQRTDTQSPGNGSWMRTWFTPLAYGIIPLVTADLIANRIPTFLFYSPRIIQSISDPFGRHWNLFGTARLAIVKKSLAHFTFGGHSTTALDIQLAVVGLGILASSWSIYRIFGKELASLSSRPVLGRVAAVSMVLIFGTLAAWAYVAIRGLAT